MHPAEHPGPDDAHRQEWQPQRDEGEQRGQGDSESTPEIEHPQHQS